MSLISICVYRKQNVQFLSRVSGSVLDSSCMFTLSFSILLFIPRIISRRPIFAPSRASHILQAEVFSGHGLRRGPKQFGASDFEFGVFRQNIGFMLLSERAREREGERERAARMQLQTWSSFSSMNLDFGVHASSRQ